MRALLLHDQSAIFIVIEIVSAYSVRVKTGSNLFNREITPSICDSDVVQVDERVLRFNLVI